MAGLLVYLPGDGAGDRAELERLGLAALLDPGIEPVFAETRTGPPAGTAAGRLVTFYPGNTPRDIDLATQHWQPAPPDGDLTAGRYWLGYVKGQKPSAGELQRSVVMQGEPVVLGDGNAWVVPICEYAPKRLTVDPASGEERSVVKEEHRRWVEWSNAIFQLIVSDGFAAVVDKGCVVKVPNGLSYAALTLSKNYRVNRDVVDLLELVDQHQVADLVMAATGISLLARLVGQKKTDRSSRGAPTS